MKVVVDTNVLITYFWSSSVFRKLLTQGTVSCISPEFALEEINKHKEIIIKKTKHTEKSFKKAREELAIHVQFVPVETYQLFLKKAVQISPDANDVDFFAIALKEKLPLWSNDAILKKQKYVTVLSTTDLLSNKEFLQTFDKQEE